MMRHPCPESAGRRLRGAYAVAALRGASTGWPRDA